MNPSKDQVTGIVERLVYAAAMAILTKLVAKGYIDQDLAAYVAGGVVAAVGGAWAWWINRPKAIMQSAAAITDPHTGQKTVVITSQAMADSTPDQNNIVSHTKVEVKDR